MPVVAPMSAQHMVGVSIERLSVIFVCHVVHIESEGLLCACSSIRLLHFIAPHSSRIPARANSRAARVHVGDSANLFQLFDRILEWGHQAQGAPWSASEAGCSSRRQGGFADVTRLRARCRHNTAVRRLEADVLRDTTCPFPRIKLIAAAVEWRERARKSRRRAPPQ